MTQVTDLDLDSGEFGPEEPEQGLTPVETNNLMAMLVDKHLAPDPVQTIDMFEVDRRMDIAMCYRIVLKSPLFGEASEASKIVEDEVRAFVRSRLEILVGMSPDNKPIEVFKSPFTDQEVVTLKSLATLKEKEIKVLNDILTKVLGATPSINQAVPVKKAVPVLVPRTNVTQTAVQAPTPVIVAPEVPPNATVAKRRPGRPPATIQVADPNTGEMIEMRAPKMRVVQNPNKLTMPTGTAAVMAQAMAAQRSIDVQNNSPIAQEILGKLGVG